MIESLFIDFALLSKRLLLKVSFVGHILNTCMTVVTLSREETEVSYFIFLLPTSVLQKFCTTEVLYSANQNVEFEDSGMMYLLLAVQFKK